MSRLDAVLAHVRPGHSAEINLTPEQRRLRDDQEGLHSLSILGHFLPAYEAAGESGTFPLTADCVRRIARRLGLPVGRNGSRRVVRRLAGVGLIEPAGSYRPNYSDSAAFRGYRVRLWAVRAAVWLDGRVRSFAKPRRLRSATAEAFVATRRRRKRLNWWEDGLMGTPDGRPPPDLSRAQRRRQRSFWGLLTNADLDTRFELALEADP